MEKDPQTPFIIVTRSASRKFLHTSTSVITFLELICLKNYLPDKREMAICVLVLMESVGLTVNLVVNFRR